MVILGITITLILAIPIVGMFRGYSVTKPQIRVISIGNDLRRHEIEASQLFIGPAEYGPQSGRLIEATAIVAERLAGYDKELPRLTAGDIEVIESLK